MRLNQTHPTNTFLYPQVYLSEFMTLEFAATHRERHPKHMGEDMMNDLGPMCLAKLVCLKNQVRWQWMSMWGHCRFASVRKPPAHSHKSHPPHRTMQQNMKVVGFHFVGPNAGEITQGFSLALKVIHHKQAPLSYVYIPHRRPSPSPTPTHPYHSCSWARPRRTSTTWSASTPRTPRPLPPSPSPSPAGCVSVVV